MTSTDFLSGSDFLKSRDRSFKARKREKALRRIRRTKLKKLYKNLNRKTKAYFLLYCLDRNEFKTFFNEESISKAINGMIYFSDNPIDKYRNALDWAEKKGYLTRMYMLIPNTSDPAKYDELEKICCNLTKKDRDAIGVKKLRETGLRTSFLGYSLTTQARVLMKQDFFEKYLSNYRERIG